MSLAYLLLLLLLALVGDATAPTAPSTLSNLAADTAARAMNAYSPQPSKGAGLEDGQAMTQRVTSTSPLPGYVMHDGISYTFVHTPGVMAAGSSDGAALPLSAPSWTVKYQGLINWLVLLFNVTVVVVYFYGKLSGRQATTQPNSEHANELRALQSTITAKDDTISELKQERADLQQGVASLEQRVVQIEQEKSQASAVDSQAAWKTAIEDRLNGFDSLVRAVSNDYVSKKQFEEAVEEHAGVRRRLEYVEEVVPGLRRSVARFDHLALPYAQAECPELLLELAKRVEDVAENASACSANALQLISHESKFAGVDDKFARMAERFSALETEKAELREELEKRTAPAEQKVARATTSRRTNKGHDTQEPPSKAKTVSAATADELPGLKEAIKRNTSHLLSINKYDSDQQAWLAKLPRLRVQAANVQGLDEALSKVSKDHVTVESFQQYKTHFERWAANHQIPLDRITGQDELVQRARNGLVTAETLQQVKTDFDNRIANHQIPLDRITGQDELVQNARSGLIPIETFQQFKTDIDSRFAHHQTPLGRTTGQAQGEQAGELAAGSPEGYNAAQSSAQYDPTDPFNIFGDNALYDPMQLGTTSTMPSTFSQSFGQPAPTEQPSGPSNFYDDSASYDEMQLSTAPAMPSASSQSFEQPAQTAYPSDQSDVFDHGTPHDQIQTNAEFAIPSASSQSFEQPAQTAYPGDSSNVFDHDATHDQMQTNAEFAIPSASPPSIEQPVSTEHPSDPSNLFDPDPLYDQMQVNAASSIPSASSQSLEQPASTEQPSGDWLNSEAFKAICNDVIAGTDSAQPAQQAPTGPLTFESSSAFTSDVNTPYDAPQEPATASTVLPGLFERPSSPRSRLGAEPSTPPVGFASSPTIPRPDRIIRQPFSRRLGAGSRAEPPQQQRSLPQQATAAQAGAAVPETEQQPDYLKDDPSFRTGGNESEEE